MFSIVIANWNGSKIIGSCLESLVNQNFKDFSVYIVDNGSTDNSISIIEGFKTKLELTVLPLKENTGFAKANNIGIEAAFGDRHKYILTLNNDIEVKPDTLEKLNSFILSNSDYDIFQLLMLNYFDRDNIDAVGLTFDSRYYVHQIAYKQPAAELSKYSSDIMGACAGAAAYSKKALKAVKNTQEDYFDSNFFAYFEDADLALRLKFSGFKTIVAKEAVVYHMHSATGKQDSPFKEFYTIRNQLLYTYKNVPSEAYKLLKYRYYAGIAKRILELGLKGKFDLSKAAIKGWKDYYNIRKKLVK
jgi:GT2 family glycosyltransferase